MSQSFPGRSYTSKPARERSGAVLSRHERTKIMAAIWHKPRDAGDHAHAATALDKAGARRVMFGTDLHVVSRNFAYDQGAEIVRDAKLSDEEWEWVAWRTANEVYRLGLQ